MHLILRGDTRGKLKRTKKDFNNEFAPKYIFMSLVVFGFNAKKNLH